MAVIFDADSLAYFAAAGAENRWWEAAVYDDEGNPLGVLKDRLKADLVAQVEAGEYHDVEYSQESEPAPAHFAYHTVNQRMDLILDHCGKFTEGGLHVLLTGKTNFRNDVATIKGYKENRKYKKPILLPECRQYMIDYHGAIVIEGREADDECSIIAYRNREAGKVKDVIVGIDKDLDMIEGDHYNWQREAFYEVGALTGIRWFYQQLLMGDTGDNIPGCTGQGRSSKKLDEIEAMTDEVEMYEFVLSLYVDSQSKKACLYKEMAAEDVVLEQGRLLWMQQWPNQLWVPPTQTDDQGNRLWDTLGEF